MADTQAGLTRAQVEGARRQAEVCGETAIQAIDRGPRRERDAGWHEGCVYQWARLAAHYARLVVAQEEANAAVAAGLDREGNYVHTGLVDVGDPDIVGTCGNCGQWQRKSNGGDCLHECRTRGFEPPAGDTRPVLSKAAEVFAYRRDTRAAQDEEGERYRSGEHEPPTTCDVCREIIPDGGAWITGGRAYCSACVR